MPPGGGRPRIGELFLGSYCLRPDVAANKVVWDVNVLEEHGVRRYPFGPDGWLDLKCHARGWETEQPRIEATTTVPVDLNVRWADKSKMLHLRPE